ncbi:MAG: AAA family ATPase, partial [Sedimenticola sp.]
MRLEKIKLAGFKSFVDPTTVPFPSNLVGIVGPNGCGKSNVIDAVRWVMGETSAKMLRGESMADVIFNGSTSRKPVGTASIELVFDNADGSAGGQYAQYSQIAVKRQVSRDGQSSYFMNGVRCRRRDITDLFLGTGLGPRSYSIIEQGMISRLIEARPEDLRAFLEEAAGISKYKERRRDTENRIKHTRENLDRLNDLREEIAKQLQHLQRQAATAERYKEYKTQERRLKAELLALRWGALDEDIKVRDRTIGERETDLEAAIAKQRRLEADIERDREAHVEANDNFNEVQG